MNLRNAGLAARRGSDTQRIAARALLTDPDPQVRLRVAQGFLGAKDKTAIPILCELLESLPLTTDAWQVEKLLRWVAWDRSPSALVGGEKGDARKKCRAEWEAWWQTNRDSIDLTTKRSNLGRPGLVMRRNNVADFFGCDGVSRWTLPVRS